MLYRQMLDVHDISGYQPARSVEIRDVEDDGIPLDRIDCPDLRSIGQAWLDLPRTGRESLPRWKDFKPANFIPVIERLCVLRVSDGSIDDLEFTLYGAHATEFIGNGRKLKLQSLRYDPLRQANYIDIRDRARRAIQNESPQYVRKSLSWNGQGFIEYELLMLPFTVSDNSQRLLQPVSAHIT